MAVAKKKPVTEAGGLPYSADTVNAYIRHANAKLGVMSNTTIRLPMTTGTLSIDLLLFGGPSGGKFMTSFGPEKAFKTTTMTECLVWYIAQEIKWRRYIAANPEASRPPPITLVYWDYENSLHTSDSGAIFSMLRKWVPDVRRVEVFGDDANLPAVYVYSEIPDLETMFEHIELLAEAIPPMAMINGRWFWKMESLPAGVIRDEAVSKLTGVPCVSAPQPIPAHTSRQRFHLPEPPTVNHRHGRDGLGQQFDMLEHRFEIRNLRVHVNSGQVGVISKHFDAAHIWNPFAQH
jgi:hypothetical protein